ncbi:MAG: type I methionyl aminopeptidase [Actinomycetota bacterium]|jgi:methionyl aminopeptidase|nr:type I methionyl aminopeptidase [Actinomycetota bacterium]
MIQIKTEAELALMREAGLVVARCHAAVRDAIQTGITTGDLDALVESTIRDAGAIPSFLGYGNPRAPFPASICASVNSEIVHGIPSRKRLLREGDVVSIDIGAILDGWHGDSAYTHVVGGPAAADETARRLLQVCEDSLWAGLAAAQAGGRLTDISAAVEGAVRPSGFGIVDHYGGHGIGSEMHQDPHLLNHGRPGRGPRLVPGMALAVEPMITVGSPETEELDDDWTVVTRDGSLAAHFEHTVAITPRGPWVLTAEDGGAGRLAALGVQVGGVAAAG